MANIIQMRQKFLLFFLIVSKLCSAQCGINEMFPVKIGMTKLEVKDILNRDLAEVKVDEYYHSWDYFDEDSMYVVQINFEYDHHVCINKQSRFNYVNLRFYDDILCEMSIDISFDVKDSIDCIKNYVDILQSVKTSFPFAMRNRADLVMKNVFEVFERYYLYKSENDLKEDVNYVTLERLQIQYGKSNIALKKGEYEIKLNYYNKKGTKYANHRKTIEKRISPGSNTIRDVPLDSEIYFPKLTKTDEQIKEFNKSSAITDVIQMTRMSSGLYEIPVTINDVLKISFILDSGASDVSIAPDVALTLIRTGTVTEADFIGSQKYSFADGSTATSKRFIIRKLGIGNHVVTNVIASISNSIDAPMLLGQSVQQKFDNITIDNINHTITFGN